MSIEQQVQDALTDFHDLIANGWNVAAAIEEAATANGLKASAFEQRLSKAIPLPELVENIRLENDKKHIHEEIYAAIVKFRNTEFETKWFRVDLQLRAEMLELLSKEMGRSLTTEEEAYADRAHREILDKMHEEFDREWQRYLRAAPPKEGMD